MSFKNYFTRRLFICNEKKKFRSVDVSELKEKFSLRYLLDFYECKKRYFYFGNLIKFFYKPTCSSSLGIVRALFGLMMVIDIPDERGLWDIVLKFGDPMRCHFPLFDWLTPLSVEYMGLLYCIMWLGSAGICLGFLFHISCLMFILPYWYIYLLDKTVWNNHSYLYGLVATLFTFTQANYSFSLDSLLNPIIKNKAVPLWNYTIIQFQFFLLYFYAGVKKIDPDWIGGYSMSSLGLHWVFNPFSFLANLQFQTKTLVPIIKVADIGWLSYGCQPSAMTFSKFFLNNEQIDFWIIHIFGFVFDLTVGFFLLIDKTRPIAMLFSAAFHLMNSCMFHIGQFPYVCLVTTPIFCNYDWPDQLKKCVARNFKIFGNFYQKSERSIITERNSTETKEVTCKQKITCCFLALYVGFQLFLPYSHFITKGYNNWTNGLYGYSWDMMVQNWYSNIIVIRVIDNQSKEEYFLDPEAWVGNTRYSKHGDMLLQYAQCLKRNLNSPQISNMKDIRVRSPFNNISIYFDIWCSLNGRFQQRMFDPRQDLLKAEWNPFKKISWLMPLLPELSAWRKNIKEFEKEVFKWSNYSDVLFIADFPGLHLENYISLDFTNVTFTVLQGTVILEQFNLSHSGICNITLFKGDSIKIKEGTFHKVYTISSETSCYMYTYNNYNLKKLSNVGDRKMSALKEDNIFVENLNMRIEKFWNSMFMLQACFKKLFLI